MRNRFLAIVLSLIAFAGCDQDFAPQGVESAVSKGVVRVLIDDGLSAQAGGRTAVPVNPDFTYDLTFSAEGKADVTATLTENEGEVLLEAGVWTLNVLGKKNGETVAEADPVTVEVPEEGDVVSVSILVYPMLNGANGTFRYLISASGGLTGVSALLTPLEVGDAEQAENALSIALYSQTRAVAPGYYRLKVTALKGAQTLIRWEVVHIYSRTVTEKTYELSEADFAPSVYLAGALTGGLEGYTPVGVTAYADEACSVPIGQGAVSEDGWNIEVEGVQETLYFKAKLTKAGSATAYYSKAVSVSGVPIIGKTDLTLAIEGYTVTFDANGGFFEDGADALVLQAPENGFLRPPSASYDICVFNGWYSEDDWDFTGETPVIGDLTVYADWRIDTATVQNALANASGGAGADNAVSLALSVPLATREWKDLLTVINSAGKYVALDMSACTMSGTEFNPGTGNAGAGKVTALVLPSAAQSIKAGTSGNATFKDFTALGSISGAGVETVGGYAFSYCTALETVSLPGATDIGRMAFRGCTSLESVSLPAATAIDDYAFYDCAALETVSLPAATDIGSSAFSGCAALETVSLPAATAIGTSAFSGCAVLTEVSLPAATAIGENAFWGCAALETVSLPMATAIGSKAFYYCTSLESVSLPMVQTLPDGYVSGTYYYGVFSGCTALTTVSLPSATTIGDYAFYNCDNLTTVNLPSATTIGASAFRGCTSLTRVSLRAATDIGNSAFSGCAALETVSLPAATSIGTAAFASCAALETVSLPVAASIGGSVFSSCGALESVSLPVATSIGNDAFYHCAALTSVSLPAATSIGSSAFYGCATLESVSLPVATSIGSSAFYGCATLESVSLPVATSIGQQAFWYCSALESVSLGALQTVPAASYVSTGLSGHYEGMFYGCTSLTSIDLPAATSIGDHAFSGCPLTSVSLPAATSIGEYAFYQCYALTSVSLPAKPPSINTGSGSGIFRGTGDNSTGTITITVPAGAVSAYTSAWGVPASVSADGAPSLYGSGHKAVLITDGVSG